MITFDPARLVRPNTLDFKPPLPSPLLRKAFHLLLPSLCRNVLKGLRVEVDETSLQRLRDLKGQRCLLLPNHPSEWDPCVIFDLGRRLNEHFYYVAAREVFDYSFGLRGWFFQRLGVYSLVRGSNDRGSLKTSMEIMSQNKGRLVIFVEGEISNQNDSLLPLEAGVVQLAFMALNDVYKQIGKNLEQLPPLYLCPISLRYLYDEAGLQEAIESALKNLEVAIGLKPDTTTRYERLKTIGAKVLSGAAGQFGYTLNPAQSPAENVAALSGFMLTKLEQVVNLAPDAALSNLDRIRRIRNLVDKILGQTDEAELTAYERRLFDHQRAVLKNFYADLGRVVNFIAIYDGYLCPQMTDHQYVELIRRLEREVFGAFQLVHPRKAVISIAEPIDIRACFTDFQQDKRAVIATLTEEIERRIAAGLQQPDT